MFQLPQNDIYLDFFYFKIKIVITLIVGTRKHAYYYMPYVILTHHVTNSNYIWRKNRQTFTSFFKFNEKDRLRSY